MSQTELERALQEKPEEVNLFLTGVPIGHLGAHTLQKHLERTPRLTILELRGSQIGHQGVLHLASGLKSHPSIAHVGIARNGADPGAVNTLLTALTGTTLQTLDLEWNAVDNSCAATLATLLRHPDCQLAAVSLERNDIRADGACLLADVLGAAADRTGPFGGSPPRMNTSLCNLNLAFNRCGARGAQALGAMLKHNGTLLTLNLSTNDIMLEGARGLVQGLVENDTLRALNLQGNQAFAAMGELGRAMRFSPALKELNLFSNRIHTLPMAKGFGEALQDGRHIMGLSLGKSFAGDALMAPILNGIAFMVNLSTLDLSHATLSHVSGAPLSAVFATCTNLQTALLDDNRLEAEGLANMASGIVHATSLTYLSLGGCHIRSDGLRALAGALKSRRGLPMRRLILNRNSIDSEALITLGESLSTSNGLTELDLASNQLSGRSCGVLLRVLDQHRGLPTITVRDNVIADLVRQSYVDLEQVRTFLADADPDTTGVNPASVAAGNNSGSAAAEGGGGNGAPSGGQYPGASGGVASGGPVRDLRAMYTNFNSTSQQWHRAAPEVVKSAAAAGTGGGASGAMRQSSSTALVAPPDVSAVSAANTTAGVSSSSGSRALVSASSRVEATTADASSPKPGHRFTHRNKDVSRPRATTADDAQAGDAEAADEATASVVKPKAVRGQNADMPAQPTPFSQRRVQLHDFESNIGDLCISDTQLRLKFAEWDTNRNGYLSIGEFRKHYQASQVARLPEDDAKVERLLAKYGKDGGIHYGEFALMMLHLVNQ